MKRPLAAVVSFYAAGLLLAEIFQPPPAALFAISFFVLALALVPGKFRPVLICLLLALAGWTNLVFHTAVISPDDLRSLIGGEAKIVSARGILIQAPQIKISARDGRQTEHSLAQVKVTGLRLDGNWQPALGEIVVATPSALPENFFAWSRDFSTTAIICRRAGFFTSSKPPRQTIGRFFHRFYPRRR